MSDLQEQLIALELVAAPGPHSFVDGPFGSEMKSSEYSECGVRLVQLQNIGDGYWIDDNKKFISLEKFETLRRHGAIPGDIVIAKMADPVARSCILPPATDQFIVVADCIKLTSDAQRFDPRFVSAAINSDRTRREAEAKSSGTTRLRINLSALKTVHIWAPQLSEQRQIACILDTMDESIAKSEAMIAKLKQVRAGLLHDLLTRGLDEHGQHRDPIAHPEQFQDSTIGRIPRGWRVCGVLDVAPNDRQAILTGPFGAQLGQADFVREGLPVLRIGNVQAGYIDWSDLQFVTEEKAQMLARFRIKCGDLLFARQGATTGRNALADARAEGCLINYHIIRVAVDRDSCSPVFLRALFNSEHVQRQINRDKGRGTREGINTGEITALRFALPPAEEQHRAVAIMRAQSRLVEVEEDLLSKLRLIKSGLMSDLLTGRVRVPEEIAVTP